MPELCVEYGQQLEFRGNNDDALSMFESALETTSTTSTTSARRGEEGKSSSADGSSPHAVAAAADKEDEEEDSAVQEGEARRAVCLAGVARCTLRSGDLRKGLNLAREAR